VCLSLLQILGNSVSVIAIEHRLPALKHTRDHRSVFHGLALDSPSSTHERIPGERSSARHYLSSSCDRSHLT
jgi:hypothetical protein